MACQNYLFSPNASRIKITTGKEDNLSNPIIFKLPLENRKEGKEGWEEGRKERREEKRKGGKGEGKRKMRTTKASVFLGQFCFKIAKMSLSKKPALLYQQYYDNDILIQK